MKDSELDKLLGYFGIILLAFFLMKEALIAIAILIGIVLLCIGVWRLIIRLQIGRIVNPDADPLLTNVVRACYSHNRMDAKCIQEAFKLNLERSNYIHSQLETIGVTKNGFVIAKTLSALKKAVNDVNSDTSIFETGLEAEAKLIVAWCDIQLSRTEDDILLQHFMTIKDNADMIAKLKYWEGRLEYANKYLNQKIVDRINRILSDIKATFPLELSDISTHVGKRSNAYENFVSIHRKMCNSTIWNRSNLISFDLKCFYNISKNIIWEDVPFFRNSGYEYYLYPVHIIKVSSSDRTCQTLSYNHIQVTTKTEEQAKFKYRRQDGSQDLRYRENPILGLVNWYYADIDQFELSLRCDNECLLAWADALLFLSNETQCTASESVG